MNAFKVGDRVRRTIDVPPRLGQGTYWTVSGVRPSGYIELRGDPNGRHQPRDLDYFELMTPAAAAQVPETLDGPTVSTDSVSEAGEDGWWDVDYPGFNDSDRATLKAFGLQVRVQVRRAVS